MVHWQVSYVLDTEDWFRRLKNGGVPKVINKGERTALWRKWLARRRELTLRTLQEPAQSSQMSVANPA